MYMRMVNNDQLTRLVLYMRAAPVEEKGYINIANLPDCQNNPEIIINS
jgi:hypothetical protein